MKKYLMYLNNKTLKLYLIIAVLSSLIFCGIYGIKVLDPTYIDWLLTGGDLTQHYLGWDAYRSSDWHFPIGMVDTLAYPNYTSIIFTDSIPILAVFFKILSPILPSDFQYFGFWGIGCFILQGILTARIIKKYTPSSIIVVIVSCLFTLTPVMILRMYAHTALAGQWILLLSLETIFNKEKYIRNPKALYIITAIIATLSSSIHIYFVLMNGIILLGAWILNIILSKRIKHGVIALSVYLLFSAVTIAFWGGFSNRTTVDTGGLGIFSFNLNALFNPQGWSNIFKDLPLWGNGQYEGFAYLGAGNILLLISSLLLYAEKFQSGLINSKKERETAFVILSIILISIMFALSHQITLNDYLLITIPLPQLFYTIWATFRSSGRVIWLTVYIVMLCNCIVLCKLANIKTVCLLLLSSVLFQIYDIKNILIQRHETFSNEISFSSCLRYSDFWNLIAEDSNKEHIIYYSLPEQPLLYSITKWALDNDKTVNNFYFARSVGGKFEKSRDDALRDLSTNDLFIFNAIDKPQCVKYPLHYYSVDGLIVGSADPIGNFKEIPKEELETYVWTFGMNTYLSENGGQDSEEGRILYPGGYSFGPYWPLSAGGWSVIVTGKNISDLVEIDIYAGRGNIPIEFEVTEKSETQVRMTMHLDENISDLEFYIKNNGPNNVILEKISVESSE